MVVAKVRNYKILSNGDSITKLYENTIQNRFFGETVYVSNEYGFGT